MKQFAPLKVLTFSTLFFAIFPVFTMQVEIGTASNQSEKKKDRIMVNINFNNKEDQHLFGVFDGHFGSYASAYVKNKLPKRLAKDKNFENDPKKSILDVFEKIEQDLRFVEGIVKKKYMMGKSGTTATTVYLIKNNMIITHIGDSRAVISRNYKAIQLTTDHIPSDPQNPTDETKRILKTGTEVVYHKFDDKPKDLWWICKRGKYPLTRSLGAFHLKDQNYGIIATPEIKTHEITPDDEFLILGTDGIWDFVTSNQVIIRYGKQII